VSCGPTDEVTMSLLGGQEHNQRLRIERECRRLEAALDRMGPSSSDPVRRRRRPLERLRLRLTALRGRSAS